MAAKAKGKEAHRSEEVRRVGHVLRAARLRLGISQEALSEATGVPQGVISRIEAGQHESPRFETVARIAAALELSLNDVAAACGLIAGPQAARSRSKMPAVVAEAKAIRHDLVSLLGRVDALINNTVSKSERRGRS